MRKIILLMGMTVDGYDAGGWIPEDAMQRTEVQDELWSQLSSVDGFVMGRVSHDVWLDFWPRQRNSESKFDAKFSRFADDVEKIVLSNTLTASEWKNSRVIGGDVGAKLADLVQQPGKDLAIVGGAKIAQALGRLQLIDEYRLWVHPEILGTGTSLFATGSSPLNVTLIEAKTFGAGLLTLHYKRRTY